jgi:hypothetical protein
MLGTCAHDAKKSLPEVILQAGGFMAQGLFIDCRDDHGRNWCKRLHQHRDNVLGPTTGGLILRFVSLHT